MGLLWGIWQFGSSIYVLDTMPTNWQLLKIASASLVAFCGGVGTYVLDPEAAWKKISGGAVGRTVLLGLMVLGLSGCAEFQKPPQVTLPVGVASVMYAHGTGDYMVAKTLIGQACKAGKLDADACAAAVEIDKRVQIYKQTIEASLVNPTAPVDWVAILKMSEDVAAMLIRLGALP